MGIFTRVRDIISANLNAMLDKAEDPEKLIRLMIKEMEDTLVEIKVSCAGAMATKKKIERDCQTVETRARQWGEKAQLAVDKGREDLAREALMEKRRYTERTAGLKKERAECDALIHQYQEDIVQLENKLGTVREKQRLLVQRHIHAQKRKRAQEDLRRLDSSEAFVRFDQFENRIERMEAEADLVNPGPNSERQHSLEEEFARLEGDEEIEKELATLKAGVEQKTTAQPQD